MITELKITHPELATPHWWDRVEALKGRESIKFAPGLNVLVGENGSGKSTVLKSIAQMLHCEQGGTQKVTFSSVSELRINFEDSFRIGAKPIHDGKPVMYCSPDKAVGLIGGTFDWDFGMTGIQNALFKGSSGQTTVQRLGPSLGVILGREEVPSVEWTHEAERFKGRSTLKRIMDGKKPAKGKHSRSTLLLDEPDRSLDMNHQIGFWVRTAIAAKKRLQVIAAAHSPLVFFLPDVNFIELTEGYVEALQGSIKRFLDTEKLSDLIERESQYMAEEEAKKKAPKKSKKKS